MHHHEDFFLNAPLTVMQHHYVLTKNKNITVMDYQFQATNSLCNFHNAVEGMETKCCRGKFIVNRPKCKKPNVCSVKTKKNNNKCSKINLTIV